MTTELKRLRYGFMTERFRCKSCGLFVKKPIGVPPGKDCVFTCTRGHEVTYHSPAVYYVQAFRDPVTHIKGNDANRGLSAMEPLKTIGEAVKRAASPDIIIVADSSKKEPIKLEEALRQLFREHSQKEVK